MHCIDRSIMNGYRRDRLNRVRLCVPRPVELSNLNDSRKEYIMRRRIPIGFTLIELLVVIAIIAILAAILFPVFTSARASARQAVCMSNEKQIALGIMMYVQDYDERTPRAVNNASLSAKLEIPLLPHLPGDNAFLAPSPSLGRPAGFLYPYLKSEAIWRCPQHPTIVNSSILNTNSSLARASAAAAHWSLNRTDP